MNFKLSQKDTWYMHDTEVENIFIAEYMTKAPGDYVKIYLYSLMFARYDMEITKIQMAKDLGTDEETIEKAFAFWEREGVVKSFGSDIVFLSLKDASYTANKKDEKEKTNNTLSEEEFKGLIMTIEQICSKTMSGTEINAVNEWLTNMRADPEVIIYVYSYCNELGKTSYRYVGKVLANWMKEGLSSAEEVEAYLEKNDVRKQYYRRIFKALGFSRNWTEKEASTMDRWIDEYGFSIERILEACSKTSGISSPNINYVNKVLENWYKEAKKADGTADEGLGKKISMKNVLSYYEYLRNIEEDEGEQRRKEVYRKVPQIQEIEENLRDATIRLSKASFGGSSEEKAKIREEIESLQAEKAYILTENNYMPDFMDIKYKCDKCRDTGIDDESGSRCECFSRRMGEAAEWLKHRKEMGN